MNQRTLIVGAGQAGLAIAAALRDLGDRGPITLAGQEPHAPYQRPPLSKDYLAGKASRPDLPLRAPAYYESSAIDLVRGERVVGLRLPGAAQAGEALLRTGRTIPFDRLALAVGARPRHLGVPGSGLDGITYLRTVEDADLIRARLPRARHVVVVGGGFVGLEVAAVARAAGTRVTVVEATERLLSRAVAPVVSEFYLHAHRRRGVEVRLCSLVAAFEGHHGSVTRLTLADGTVLPADLVVIGVGVQPRTTLAERAGLAVDGGVVVDLFARTSDPAVVAAGDCTVQADGSGGRLRLESVDNALTQGRIAAATLMGRTELERPVPWFWSNQGDLRLQIAGLTAGYDHVVVRGEPDRERFSVLYYRGGTLLGVDAVNRPADYITVRTALKQGAMIPLDRAGDTSVPLKELLEVVVPSAADGA